MVEIQDPRGVTAMRFLLTGIGLVLALVVLGVPTRGARSSPQTELVQNGSFEQDTDGDGIPDFWRGRNLGPLDVRVPEPYDGTYSFRIVGEPGVIKRLRQGMRTPLPKGTVLSFRAAAKVEGASREGGKLAYKIVFVYTDSTTDTQVIKFSLTKEGWQQGILGGNLLKDLRMLVVSVAYSDQTGSALFDDAHAEVK